MIRTEQPGILIRSLEMDGYKIYWRTIQCFPEIGDIAWHFHRCVAGSFTNEDVFEVRKRRRNKAASKRFNLGSQGAF
jgi:hypothetical protein